MRKTMQVQTVAYPLLFGQENLNMIALFEVFDFQVTPSGRFSVVGSQVLNKDERLY